MSEPLSRTEMPAPASELDLPLAGCALMAPEVLSSPAPWAGHIPFAAWLVASMRPRTLVELGVYSGISFLSMCQAAQRYQVPLRAWGVDTWEGDEHAGLYGPEILWRLREQHDERYGAFSTLLQSTFDDARSHVADGSIDLLHIDGLHTYDAVRHDFESWQGKLSDRAVVLFHDIAVTRDDFGVWRYWAELQQRYPSLAFEHSSGLGVLLVGPAAPDALVQLTQDCERWEQARGFFRALGERLELRAEQMHLNGQLSDLAERSDAQHAWIEQQDKRILEAERAASRDQESIGSLSRELARRDTELLASGQARERVRAELDALRAEQFSHAAQTPELRFMAQRQEQELGIARAQRDALHLEVQELLASRSWRATAGLRKLGGWLRRIRSSPMARDATKTARRLRSAVRYAATGDWRELMRRVLHLKQQAAEIQRLSQFSGHALRCGILATPHTRYVAHALQVALQRAGLPAQIVDESLSGYPLELYFVVCPQMFKRLPPGEKRIAFQMEQTVSSRWLTPDYLAVLEHSLAVLDYAQTNIVNLASHGIVYPHVFLTPIGGVRNYERQLGGAVEPDESCDVLFYGDANAPRRRRLLEAIGARFKLRVVGNSFGTDMHRALAGAKAVVNLHYYEGALLETTRIFESLSLGKSVVSERAADQADHGLLESVVRFVSPDDPPALVAALEQALQEQSIPESRADHARRCEAIVSTSQDRFEFMLYRMLLARRIINYPKFDQLTTPGAALTDRVALSLPETWVRRLEFESKRPADTAVFDGLRYSPGWIGCALSYKHLATRALQQGLEQIEIMEDDVDFPANYPVRRERALAYLAARPGQWDVFVGVMALVHPETRVLKVERIDGETFVTLDRMISMVCNIYTPDILRRIASWDETREDANTNTIDRFLQSQRGVRAVVTLPFLVGHHEELDSSLWGISNARYGQMILDAQDQLERLVLQNQSEAANA